MNRREFLQAGAATAGLALAPAGFHVAGSTAAETKRVGLIGTGWYGKADLLRLIQVAPVEVVSLCDVDKKMLAEAAEIVANRQASKKTPRTFADYREMLKQKDLDIVLIATPDHWHALPMIAACEAGVDMYVQKPISVDVAEGKAMLDAAQAPAGRPGGHPAPQHAAPHRGPRPGHPRGEAGQDRAGRDLLLLPHAQQQQPARHQSARLPRLGDVDRPGPHAAV